MKNIRITVFIVFAILFLSGQYNANAQTQSWLLPIPGSTSPTGPCKMINFSDYTNPVITDLPSHSFTLPGPISGNPHDEDHLNAAINPSTQAYLMDEKYLGQHPMFAQTVVHDEQGNLLFFIVDNNIYNRYGETMKTIC